MVNRRGFSDIKLSLVFYGEETILFVAAISRSRSLLLAQGNRRSFQSLAMAMEIDFPKPEDLFRAAENGDFSLFTSLSAETLGWARSLRNEDGRSLIHVAASAGRSQVVDVLSAGDPSATGVNSKDEEGWAPIHSAASIGNAEIVEILLSRGADANLANDGGRTALHYAASKGWSKVAEILVNHGAKINKKDKVGCTPLHRAASTGKAELCELLIEEGAEIDVVDKAGQTPLMHAVICHYQQIALLLIRHGASLDVEDKEGYTVLGLASDDLRRSLIDAAKAMLEG
ncbi:26S proteasome non-ATPase regulatory subunit 10-like [Zingiber officinale]|uniref:26S proteasome non-ATPase regulatory subunit 10-like n=1 Tax=Zingiber officinale TaxID=94328 RepID=UPI001C4BB72C|nr:26S proteasome non-ATPase regulatory subunit 10-like [Zingiber officinale]